MLASITLPAMALTYDSIASEFTCQCGCNLILTGCDTMVCSVKDSLKATITGMIKQGMTKEQIIKTMRTNYKDKILSAPPKEGFNLTGWVTPFLVVGIAAIGLVFALVGWRRHQEDQEAATNSGKKIDEKYEEQIKKELNDFRW
jgi:cytochrome c-type biogenesis protein CcmH